MADQLVVQRFRSQAKLGGSHTAFFYCRKRDQKWSRISWRSYLHQVEKLAWALQDLGVKKGDFVAIMAQNRPEWIITQLAIWSVGGVCVPIDPSFSQRNKIYILKHVECSFLIVDAYEDDWNSLPVKQIMVFDDPEKRVNPRENMRVHLYSDAIAGHSQSLTPFHLQQEVEYHDRALVLYTSGTTGQPKGVVHTHGNLIEAMNVLPKYLLNDSAHGTNRGGVDRLFSFLPLSHVAEQALVVLGSLSCGHEVAFARSMHTLLEDLQRCRPSILLCVPRLWEKMYEKVQASLLTVPLWKHLAFDFGYLLGHVARVDGHRVTTQGSRFKALGKISDLLVSQKIRERLGLTHCRLLFTGSAPTSPEVIKFFGAFGILIREVYGLTENLSLGMINDSEEILIGSCGKSFEGSEVRIESDGEICLRAPWLFEEYYKNQSATKAVYKPGGWFKTGDLGRLDEQGRLWISGRKKQLIKTSGGKYVAPRPLEQRMLSWPEVEEAIVVGDGRKYCVALIAIRPKSDKQTAKERHSAIRVQLKQSLEKLNRPLASYETIKRIGVVNGQTIAGMDRTEKRLNRAQIADENIQFVDRLYHSEDVVVFE